MTAILKVDTIQDTAGNNIINESSDTITIGAAGDIVTVPGTEVKSNKLSPASGTSLQIGDSGDTITIPSGATITNSGTASGFGGITDFDSWRLTSNFTGSGGTIDGNWERQDTNSQNIKQGTGMTQSSGVFTFPNTGIWKVEFWTNLVPAGSYNYNGFYVEYSTNSGSNFSYLNGAWGSTSASGKSVTIGASNFLNVSNASTYRVQAKASGAGNAEYQANTNVNYTYFNFIRLGDST